MRAHRILAAPALAAVVTAGSVASAPPASAWPRPYTSVSGGECLPDGSRAKFEWMITNLESGFQRSPLTIDHVHLSVGWPMTDFTPNPIPNTGTDTATAEMTVPPHWTGTLYLTYRGFYTGADGDHITVGYGEVQVTGCTRVTTPQPCARQVA